MRWLLVLPFVLWNGAALAAPYDDCQKLTDRAKKIAACTAALKSKKLEPNQKAFAYLHRGYAYRLEKKYDAAFDDIAEVIRLNPGSGRAYYERGLIYRQREDYQSAVRDLDVAVRRMTDKPFVWLSRGRTNYLIGNLWQAVQDFDEAIRLNPEYSTAFDYRGRARCKQNRADMAVADWAEMHRVDPASATGEQEWLKKQGFLEGEISGERDSKMIAAQEAYARAGCPGL